MSCEHDCPAPPVFPKTIFNRPGLSRIDYRIGTYAELRAHILDTLDKSTALQTWTHRGVDDPAIAFVESASIVADILTFYQSLYANEAYLATAQWRESIVDLARLLGYRLAPGLGGEGTFAIGIKPTSKAVTVPQGFGLKAQIEGGDKPADFETSEAITAYAHLSRFHFYRPRSAPPNIHSGDHRLEVQTVGGLSDVASIATWKPKQGDRVMLVDDADPLAIAEIVVVDKVETVLDRTLLTFKGSLNVNRGTTIKAYPIKRSFRHFGHNAPSQLTTVVDGTVTQENIAYTRSVFKTENGGDYYSRLDKLEMPLDRQVDDLALGAKIVCQGSF